MEKAVNRYEKEVLEVAKAMLRESPGTTPQKALRHAKDIVRNRGKFKVTAKEKVTNNDKTPYKQVPEHIRRTISKQRHAEQERAKAGRSLPTARFVKGGKVSPK